MVRSFSFVLFLALFAFLLHYFESAFIFLLTLASILIILQCHENIEENPGPGKLKTNSFSVCHWNLNYLSAHNFSKLTQLKAHNSIYKNDFACLLETYLDTSIPDKLIDIKGYKLIRVGHPNNTKRGEVSTYYKRSLPVRAVSLPYFKETLLSEMSYNNKKSDGFCYLSFP